MSDRVVGRSPCIVMPSCSSRTRVDPERPTRSTRSGCGLSEQLVKIIWSRRAAAVGNPVETKKRVQHSSSSSSLSYQPAGGSYKSSENSSKTVAAFLPLLAAGPIDVDQSPDGSARWTCGDFWEMRIALLVCRRRPMVPFKCKQFFGGAI